MAFLSPDEVGKLERIPDEEYRRVVSDQIPIAFPGVELDGEATHVALGIGRAEFPCDRGEAREELCAFIDFRENFGARIARNVLGHGQGAIGAPPFCVHHPLRNALAVLMRQFLDQLVVLHHDRTARPRRDAVLVIGDRRAATGGHRFHRCLHHSIVSDGLNMADLESCVKLIVFMFLIDIYDY